MADAWAATALRQAIAATEPVVYNGARTDQVDSCTLKYHAKRLVFLLCSFSLALSVALFSVSYCPLELALLVRKQIPL